MEDLLRDGLSYCLIDGTAVFLDLPRDRYFRLPPERNREFVEWIATRDDSRLVSWPHAARQSPFIHSGDFRLGQVARAMWMQRRIERRLGSYGLASVVGDLRHVLSARSADLRADSGSQIIRAFEQAKLLRTAADRCLPRSIALALCLTARKCRAHVVLGVKLGPFAAHCWAQSGDEVLNDSAEEVARYTPILVV